MERLGTIIITTILAVVLAASVLIPVISSTTKTDESFTNTGLFYVDAEEETVTLEYDNSAPTTVIINGESIVINSSYDATVLYTEDSVIRFIPNSGGQLQSRGSLGPITIKTLDLEYSDGTVTGTITSATDQTTTISGTYSELTHIAVSADRIMTTPSPQHVLEDSKIEAMGIVYAPTLSTANSVVHIIGSVGDGVEITPISTSTGDELGTITISDISINAEAVDGYLGLYELTSITFTMTDAGGSYDATFNIYTIPSSVTAEYSEHLSDTEITLVSIIPILVFAGMVVGIATVIGRRAEIF